MANTAAIRQSATEVKAWADALISACDNVDANQPINALTLSTLASLLPQLSIAAMHFGQLTP